MTGKSHNLHFLFLSRNKLFDSGFTMRCYPQKSGEAPDILSETLNTIDICWKYW